MKYDTDISIASLKTLLNKQFVVSLQPAKRHGQSQDCFSLCHLALCTLQVHHLICQQGCDNLVTLPQGCYNLVDKLACVVARFTIGLEEAIAFMFLDFMLIYAVL